VAAPASPAATTPTSAKTEANPAPAASQPTAAGASGRQAAASASPAQSPKPDPQAVDDLVARIAERESLDPASKARLTQDLHQTDPALWPALMQYFQAALAYRRQTEERNTAAGTGQAAAPPAGSSLGPPPMPSGPASPNPSFSRNAAPAQPVAPAERAVAQSAPLPPPSGSQPPGLLPSYPRTEYGEAPAAPLARSERPLQVASDSEAPRPKGEKPADKPDSRGLSREGPGTAAVVAAGYVAAAGANSDPWSERLDGTIKSMEAEARQSPQSSAEVARQARLRLLYLAAGRREDALRPIPSASPALQDSWSQMVYGLATWMDTERFPDAGRRAGEARQPLVAAANRLGELAPLLVRNVSFVREVKSYGDVTPFEKTELAAGQEVLLYAEVENFKSEETPKGFHTQFRGSYEIFDARGQRVTAQELGKTDETCRNQRRDFFLVYNFRLPKRIYGGRHTLQLTVEDLQGQKIGQSSLEFTVKAGGE
jgi:hypothetical protein